MSSALTTRSPDRRPPARRAIRSTVAIVLVLAFAIAACGSGESTIETGVPAEQRGQPDPPGPPTDRPPGRKLVVTGAALDAHTHVISPELAGGLAGPGTPGSTADDLVERLDEANIERAVVLSLAYFPELPDEAAVRNENNYTAAEVAKYPDRLIGFCAVNPLRPADFDELDRCIDELGMAGVKLHVPATGLDLRDPDQAGALNAMFDRLADKDVPVLIHVGSPLGIGLDSDAFAAIGQIVAVHPTVRLTFAHCTNDGEIEDIETWLHGFGQGLFNVENLFVDTSSCLEFYQDAPSAQKELVVWWLRSWGLDRVLLGSDYLELQPAQTPLEARETLASYPFTQDEIDIIINNDGSSWLNGDG